MTKYPSNNLHNPNGNKSDSKNSNPAIHSYYDEKFDRLSERSKSALRIIELECETVRDLLEICESTKPENKRS